MLKLHNFQTLVDRLAAVRNWQQNSQEYTRLKDKVMHRWLHIRAEIKDKLHSKKGTSVTLDEWLRFFDQVLSDASYHNHLQE